MRKVGVTTAVLLVAAVIAAILLRPSARHPAAHGGSTAASPPEATSATAAATTTPTAPSWNTAAAPNRTRLRQLASELSSSSRQAMADALVPAVAVALAADGQRPVPAGSSVSIDTGTLKASGASATVGAAVTVPGRGVTRFTLLLLDYHGRWVVMSSSRR